MSFKKGKLSPKEQEFIRQNVDKFSPKQLALNLNRTESIIQEFYKNESLSYIGMSQEKSEDVELEKKLKDRPYYPELEKQLSPDELRYFVATWIHLMNQFRSDVMYSEELALKQRISMEIMCDRSQQNLRKTIEQLERMEEVLKKELSKPETIRDPAKIMMLENDIAMIRNSLSTYTTEYAKIMDKIKDITKELKADRSARVKKFEDSKTSFAGFLTALEDEDIRAKVGEDIEIMRLAKDTAKDRLSQFHKFADGFVDQPLLTPETIREDRPEDDTK